MGLADCPEINYVIEAHDRLQDDSIMVTTDPPAPKLTWFKMSFRQISRSLETAKLIVALTAETPVKFHGDRKTLNPFLAASRFREILR